MSPQPAVLFKPEPVKNDSAALLPAAPPAGHTGDMTYTAAGPSRRPVSPAARLSLALGGVALLALLGLAVVAKNNGLARLVPSDAHTGGRESYQMYVGPVVLYVLVRRRMGLVEKARLAAAEVSAEETAALQGAGELDDARIEQLILARQSAKKRKDFAAADGLRAWLRERGSVLEDLPAGVRWKSS